MAKKRSIISYAYIIVAACFLIMVVASGAQFAFGVFFKPISENFGWTRAATAGAYTIGGVVAAFMGFVSGRLADKFGTRKVIMAAGIFLGSGYVLGSMVQEIWQYYLTSGVIVAIGAGGFWVPAVSMISRWFARRRGLITGIAISGIGLGMGVYPLMASHLLTIFEWRKALFIVGISTLVLLVLLAQLLERKKAGVKEQSMPWNEAHRSSSQTKGYTFSEALKTKQLWMLIPAWMFYGIIYNVISVHCVPYATDIGMTAVAAAGIMTIMGLIGIPGRIGIGYFGDRINIKSTFIVSFSVLTAGFVGLVFSETIISLQIFALVFGVFSGLGIMLAPFLADLFGLKALGAITGAVTFANSIGSAIGPTLAGGIFDATLSYHLAFVLCAFLGVVCTVMVALMKPTKKLKKGDES
jgi:MFS transporter, OFA family, oxalate/formate antiporter